MSTDGSTTINQQLYRLYGADGELLYIGISYSAITRFSQHKVTQPWVGDVARVDIETRCCTRAQIEAAEREAIIREKPKHNVVHAGQTPRPPKRSPWKCDNCRGPADYIQCLRDDRTWQCVCKRCDTVPTPAYWIDSDRIKSPTHIAEWTEHLGHKNWFTHDTWQAMLKRAWAGAR